QRFQTATAFAQAFEDGLRGQWAPGLTEYVSSSKRSAAVPQGPTEASGPPPRGGQLPRSTVIVSGFAALLVVTLVAVVLATLHSGSPTLATIPSPATPYPPTITVGPGTPTPTPYPPTATVRSGPGGTGPTATPTATVTPTVTPIPYP